MSTELLSTTWWPGALIAVLAMLMAWASLYWSWTSHVRVVWRMNWPIPSGFLETWQKEIGAMPWEVMISLDNGQTLYGTASPWKVNELIHAVRTIVGHADIGWEGPQSHAEVTVWRWNWTGKRVLIVGAGGAKEGEKNEKDH